MADWIISAYTGFAVSGETVELTDENNAVINVTGFGVAMFVSGRTNPFTITSGNFTVIPPVAPATYPNGWALTISTNDVAGFPIGVTPFNVVISDAAGALFGTIQGAIHKLG